MENTLLRIEELEKLLEENTIMVSGKVSEDIIKSFEEKLGYKFPVSYRKFLEKFGQGYIGTRVIFGIDVEHLEFSYDNYEGWNKKGKPLNLFPIYYSCDTIDCLDLSKMEDGECPVIMWSPFYKSSVISDNFKEYLDEIIEEIEEELYDEDEEFEEE